jgi:hypothetical protein
VVPLETNPSHKIAEAGKQAVRFSKQETKQLLPIEARIDRTPKPISKSSSPHQTEDK